MADGVKESVKSRQPLQRWAIIGFIAFFVFGYFLAAPCLCPAGAVKGFYASIFYAIVVIRLLYGLLKRNLRLSDYLLWVGSFVSFCILTEFLF